MEHLTIQIVTWNSATALRTTLPALRHVDPSIAVIRVIDNASRDGSVALVREALPTADVVLLPHNTGFAGGHNEGFRRCQTPLVLVLNPDVTLRWAVVVAVLAYFKEKNVAAVQGKLLREANIIDSTGIMLTAAFNGNERGAGETDTGHYETVQQIDAATGACALYRLAALKHVSHPSGEIFDERFWAYKEDVDLGWRLRRQGWKVLYVPLTLGFHPRRLRREGRFGWSLAPLHTWQRLRDARTRYSFRNWVWMVLKNATPAEIVVHSPALVARLGALLLLSLFYWPLAAVWLEVVRGGPAMIAKRHNSG